MYCLIGTGRGIFGSHLVSRACHVNDTLSGRRSDKQLIVCCRKEDNDLQEVEPGQEAEG